MQLHDRDARGGGSPAVTVYHTVEHLWEVESKLPAILSHWIGTFY